MDLKLVKDIYNMHINGFDDLDFKVIHEKNYDIAYSTYIKDLYCNFISNFYINNKEDFDSIINEASKTFSSIDRKTAIYLLPNMKDIYENKEKYFYNNMFELMSTEVWQIYTDFDKLDEIKTYCNFDVKLELTTDMEKYADAVMRSYQSGDDKDPYGDLDDGYRQAYINYKNMNTNLNNEFYFIKANGEIIGTTQSIYDKNLYGIYSLAIRTNYRNKGIGKEVIKKQLEMCKDKNIKTAYLQTEQDFYPAKLYRKLGFKDLCEVYYYVKK